MKINNNKGAALLTTLLIGVLALVVILALFTFILFGKSSSVIKERYTSALEAAKGTAFFVIGKLKEGATNIYCYDPTNSSERCPCYKVYWNNQTDSLECFNGTDILTDLTAIDLGSYSTLQAADGGTYNLNATLFFKDLSQDGEYDIYTIEINAVNNKTNEKATIDFIYKAPRMVY